MPNSEVEEWLYSVKDRGTRPRFIKRKIVQCLNIFRKWKLPLWNRLERRKENQDVEKRQLQQWIQETEHLKKSTLWGPESRVSFSRLMILNDAGKH